MQEIAKKSPKAFLDVRESLFEAHKAVWDDDGFVFYGDADGELYAIAIPDIFIYSYLMLEYFPAHGIGIEYNKLNKYSVIDYNKPISDQSRFNGKIKTPQQAIEKALEIKEDQI